ncbi:MULTISPECIES: PTS transporter subunit EIIB [unclassified Erwinia]|uniref:PTS transporter subunit EIIB n=1 Tax=unclassified Erwinia TaxID=2622719 RepID=UPI0009E7F39E|nr:MULTISPECIES: PTS transporter subunit EIIB [unclassified Erwinia]
MGYASLCREIINGVGGRDNIVSVTHCANRLRFKRITDENPVSERFSVGWRGRC